VRADDAFLLPLPRAPFPAPIYHAATRIATFTTREISAAVYISLPAIEAVDQTIRDRCRAIRSKRVMCPLARDYSGHNSLLGGGKPSGMITGRDFLSEDERSRFRRARSPKVRRVIIACATRSECLRRFDETWTRELCPLNPPWLIPDIPSFIISLIDITPPSSPP